MKGRPKILLAITFFFGALVFAQVSSTIEVTVGQPRWVGAAQARAREDAPPPSPGVVRTQFNRDTLSKAIEVESTLGEGKL